MTNMHDQKIRWGIIGCGDVTEVKSGPAYQKTVGFELTAVMRRDEGKAKDFARRHQIDKYYTQAESLINDPTIDAIYIATPPDTHKHYGIMVAEAGKTCCIEKPLAPSYNDSKTIVDSFDVRNIPLFVAYYRRSLPRFTQIKTWLQNNAIGNVKHIGWHLSKPASKLDLSGAYNWRTDGKTAPGGYFDDLASHGLDLFTYLLGNITKVSGISLNQQGLYSAQDAFTASWIHEDNITGSGTWNFGCYKAEDRIEVWGDKGKIEFSIFEEQPFYLTNDQGTQEVFIANPENVQLYHVAGMRDELINGIKYYSNGSTALHTSWVMDKILGKI